MEKFVPFTSKAIPLPMKDIDTDMIIPAQFLTSIRREGYGENLFRRLRDNDPKFPLNQERYSGAEILIAESNFGCGSSREHAVWALQGAGIRAVIAPSFADIFSNNSANNGLLLIRLAEELTRNLLRRAASQEGLTLSIDLENQVVLDKEEKYPFDYDPFTKHCLQHGLDSIDYILSHGAALERHQKSRDEYRFFSIS